MLFYIVRDNIVGVVCHRFIISHDSATASPICGYIDKLVICYWAALSLSFRLISVNEHNSLGSSGKSSAETLQLGSLSEALDGMRWGNAERSRVNVMLVERHVTST